MRVLKEIRVLVGNYHVKSGLYHFYRAEYRQTIDFLKTRSAEYVMRTVRSLAFRANPDAREIQLVRAFAIEVQRAMERAGRGSSPKTEVRSPKQDRSGDVD